MTGLRLCNRASQEAASTLIRSRRDRTTGFGAGGGTDDRPFLSRQAVPDAQLFDGPFCANAGAPLAAIRDGLSILPSKPRRPRQEGVKLVVSDDHGGLKAARQAVFNEASCQRCQFHLMRNAMAHALKVAMRPEIAGNIRRFFEADA